MNIPEPEIEKTLRGAPRFNPPAGMKARLIAQIALPPAKRLSKPTVSSPLEGGWFLRWWPTVAAGALSLVCGVVLAMQQMQIQQLKDSIRQLSHSLKPQVSSSVTPTFSASRKPAVDAGTSEQAEIERLKQEAAALGSEIKKLEQLQADNQKLRAQLAAPVAGVFTPAEEEALAKAREKAMSIQCINNLKQLGLAARVWSLDNGDIYPSNIILMTNEMSTPKILFCPADNGRQAVSDWSAFTAANCSYQYLAPNGTATEPFRILFRCPIHGHVGLCDGSVQGGVAKNHPEWIVQREGKFYCEPPGSKP